ncbi:MAG: sensor of ECF-type sigma factor [Flavobacterium sp.]|nr:sensor of ECF-type sigma factor [Flavobacterium sp.]
MKSKITLLLILLVQIAFAQPGKFREKREQIKSLKIAHITHELSLTSAEAEKFWPVYNEFDDKMFELKGKKMKSVLDKLDGDGLDKLSEKEALSLLNQIDAMEEDTHQLKKKFISNLRNILPAVKILKLKRAEEQFSRKLLQQYKGKK